MAAPALQLSHVTLAYGGDAPALADVSLEVAYGERLCVLGANGSGKSTLAKVIAGLLAPDAGSVSLLGEKCLEDGTVDFDAYQRARRGLGLVFQNPDDQIVTTVVEEDVAFGPENLGVPSERIGELVAREIHRVALDDYAKADPTRLSGGQKQRVAIAGALAMESQVLVLDEPGALLDVRGRRSIVHVMDRLQAAGTTLVHVTHFMSEAFGADRVVVLDHGRVALEGTPAEVFAHADELRGLGLAAPEAARLAEKLRDRGVDVAWTCSEDDLLRSVKSLVEKCAEAGAALPASAAARPRATDDAIVTCDGVCYSYSGSSQGRNALRDVSLSVDRGESVAIVGQTGSGKSTLLRLVCGLEVPDAGSITIDGVGTARRRDRRRLAGTVGYVMQHPERQLFAETVGEDVAYGPRNLRLPDSEVAERVRVALEVVGLSHRRDSSPFELSGGQRRLAAIAGVLAMDPSVLVLDEPTAGLDPHGRSELRAILAAIQDRGTTTVQVTHSMEDAARADHVVVLDQSRILMEGSPREVFSAPNAPVLHDHGLGIPWPLAFALALAEACPAAASLAASQPLTEAALADGIAALVGRGEA